MGAGLDEVSDRRPGNLRYLRDGRRGTLQSLTWLAHAGKVDLQRVLVLRTASNYDQQREGATATESLAESKVGQYSAYLPALDAAYRVGHVVVDNLVANWAQTRDHIPSAQ